MLFTTDLSFYQLLGLPVVLWVAWRLRFLQLRIPGGILLAVLVGALCGAGFSYSSHQLVAKRGLLVGRLSGDEYENRSRLFRQEINSFLQQFSELKAVRYHGEIENYDEAERLLSPGSNLTPVVWGNERWLNMALPEFDRANLSDYQTVKDLGSASSLEIINSVPMLGLSYDPVYDSARFLATLAQGIKYVTPLFSAGVKADKSKLSTAEIVANAEIDLRDAGSYAAHWTSFAHRAYPWFLEGNLHLKQALEAESLELGELECAKEAFRTAHNFLRAGDNAELSAAIANNIGIVYYLDYLVSGDPASENWSRMHLRRAIDSNREPNTFNVPLRAGRVALLNLGRLKRAGL